MPRPPSQTQRGRRAMARRSIRNVKLGMTLVGGPENVRFGTALFPPRRVRVSVRSEGVRLKRDIRKLRGRKASRLKRPKWLLLYDAAGQSPDVSKSTGSALRFLVSGWYAHASKM